MPGENEEWRDPKRVVSRGSVISKRGLVPTKRYQVRVRARLGPCRCGFANDSDYSYIKCAEEGEGYGCMWTPWSPPSASVTPMS